MRRIVILGLLLLMFDRVSAQMVDNYQSITAGAQFSPIFPASFLGTGSQSTQNSEYSVSVNPKFGFSTGMVVRYAFHKRLALETGLNFVQRKYDLDIKRDSVFGISGITPRPDYSSRTDFTIIGYEHPIKLLVFVRLAEKLYMNAAGGFQFTFYPSDIFTTDEDSRPNDQHFKHSSIRLGLDGKSGEDGFFHMGGIANLGMEYRTKKAGYFYLGATYHIPFADIYRSKFQYVQDDYNSEVQLIQLKGTYFTFDVKYFFNAKPLIPKGKKEKTKKRTSKNDSEE